VLRDGDLVLCETGAIVRHLARRTCLDGATLAEKALVDMYCELSQDIWDKRGAVYDLDGHDKAAGLKKLVGFAEAACDGAHFVGDSMTLADIAMFKTLQFLEEVVPGSLSSHPRLSAFVHEFEQLPAVAAYLTSDKRMPLTHNELGKEPHAGLPGYKFIKKPPPGSYATTWEGLKK
jgi:glutathione S-transferase